MTQTSFFQSKLLSEPTLQCDLKAVSQQLHHHLPRTTAAVPQACATLFSSQAKLLRPTLLLLCCRLCGYQDDKRLTAATIGEYIHVASLLHDDVVDQSPLRRGHPTCHTQWDNATSVLVGDVIYAKACELIATTDNMELLRLFAHAIGMMSEGELLQRKLRYQLSDQEEYLQVLGYKTGALLAACAAAAAALACSHDLVDPLWQYGYHLGVAYQLVDDTLDLRCRDADHLGKPALKDLSEGTLTLPVLLLDQQISEADKPQLTELLTTLPHQPLTPQSAAWLLEQIDQYHTCEQTLEKARHHHRKAQQLLHQHFTWCPKRDHMDELAQIMLQRSR